MLKGILGFLLFLFFLIVLLVMLTGSYILKKFRELRKAAEDAAEQQAFRYREETGRQRQQYSNRQGTQSSQQTRSSQGAQSTQSTQESRRTQTDTGETIIDNRRQKRENKKIFDDSDGEYVEFTES